MGELKRTIDQLKNYLRTGLKCHAPSIDADYRRDANVPVEFEMIGIVPDYLTIDCEALQTDVAIEEIIPICYRLSDLDKFIRELGFVPAMRIRELIKEIDGSHRGFDYRQGVMIDGSYCGPMALPYWIVQQLFQWHFWPFGDEYFEQGLVIDKLKINS